MLGTFVPRSARNGRTWHDDPRAGGWPQGESCPNAKPEWVIDESKVAKVNNIAQYLLKTPSKDDPILRLLNGPNSRQECDKQNESSLDEHLSSSPAITEKVMNDFVLFWANS